MSLDSKVWYLNQQYRSLRCAVCDLETAAEITIGDDIVDGTPGSVLYINAAGNLGQDNTVFYWNETDNRLGIGNNAPSEALHVTGNIRFSGALMPNNLAGTAGQFLTSGGAGVAPTWSTLSTTLLAVSAASTTAPNSVYQMTANIPVNFKSSDGNSILYIDETNERVGIGTASPSNQLHIYNSINAGSLILLENPNVGSSAFSGFELKTNGGSSYMYRTSIAYGAGVPDSTVIQDAGGGDIAFFGAAEAMRIKNAGNIVIGNTTGSNQLNIYSTIGGATSGITVTSTAASSYANINLQNNSTTAQFSYSGTTFSSGVLTGATFFIYSPGAGGTQIVNDNATGKFQIYTGGVAASNLRQYIFPDGHIVFPTTVVASANYGMLSVGSGAFDGATAGFFTGSANGTLLAGNLASGSTSDLFNFQLGGVNVLSLNGTTKLLFGTAANAVSISAADSSYAPSITGRGIAINTNITTLAQYGVQTANGVSITYTSGTGGQFQAGATVSPASGSGVYNIINSNAVFSPTNSTSGFYRGLSITYTINATGTAQTSVAQGIYLNATETNLNGMAHNLLQLQTGGLDRFYVTNTGTTYVKNNLSVNGAGGNPGGISFTGSAPANGVLDWPASGMTITTSNIAMQTGVSFLDIGVNNANSVNTSGTNTMINSIMKFAPTSGTAVHNNITLSGTINQTGGANGITRGLYVNPTLTAAADYRAIEVVSGRSVFGGRVNQTQGADVASASTIALGNGNSFELTGTTTVNLITSTNWTEGSIITLIANENVTINHATATSGSDVTILLAGAANFAMTANDTLTLIYSSTTAGGVAWREICRVVI